jgi:protoporphyrinogen oxidase
LTFDRSIDSIVSSVGPERRPEQHDVVIVGGGIAGLYAAHRLRHRQVVLLEEQASVGGRVRSARHGDYWANLGAQFLAGEGPLRDLVQELEIPTLTLRGSRPAIALKDRVVVSESPARFVLQLPFGVRGRVEMTRLGLKLRRTYRRLARNPDAADAQAFRDRLDSMSAADYFSGIGDPDVQTVLDSLIRFWMGAEAAEISAGHAALYIGLSVADLSEVPPFSMPLRGNQSIPEALAESLGNRIHTSSRATAVRQDGSSVEVEYSAAEGSGRIFARACILAVPAYAVRELVRDLPAEVDAALGSVRYGTYVNVAFFTDESGPMPWDGIYAITVAGKAFQVVTNPATVLHRGPERKPGGALLAYAGGAPARALAGATDEDVARIFERDLNELLPETEGRVERRIVQRWPRAIPYWQPGGRSSRQALRRPHGRVHLAGDYVAYPSMQVAATSGKAAAEAVEAALEGR